MESLTIPLKIDSAGAMAELRRLAEQGGQTGHEIDEGMTSASKSATGLAGSIGSVVSVAGTMSVMRELSGAMAQSFKEASADIAKMAEKYVQLRETLQQVAALTGKTPNAEFTVDQARQAEAAYLKPQEWISFQEKFQSYAGAYLEGDQQKMKPAEAVKYQQQLAAFAKARGIPAEEIAQLGGGVLQFSTKELTSDEAMAEVGKEFKTLERAPTPVSQLLPQMTRIMAQGASGAEASQLLGIMSEAMPGEEQTGVENTLKALTQSLLKGKGGQLGMTKGMTPLERIKAAAENLVAREGKGEDIDPLIAELFPDLREQRGIRGFMSRGVTAKGFERTRGYAAETPADFTQTAIAEYQTSEAGLYAREQAGLARAEIERGARMKNVSLYRTEAEKTLTESGRFEQVTAGDVIAALNPLGDDRRTRLINQQALQNARQDRGEDYGRWTADDVVGQSRFLTDQRLHDLLEEQNKMMRDDQKRPLSAPARRVPTRPEDDGGSF